MADVLEEVREERIRQDQLWGEQNHPSETGPDAFPMEMYYEDPRELTAEGVAKEAKEVCAIDLKNDEENWTDIFLEEVFEALAEPEGPNLRTELIQAAAVAVAWVECLDRRSGKQG